MSPYDRLVARLAARRLDRELAEGASPASSSQLNRRASALTAPAKRRELAEIIRRIARNEVVPAAFGVRLAASREQTEKARPELEKLARRLADTDPVDPRGVALTQELLSDGSGPLHWDRSQEDLGTRLAEALAALGPAAKAAQVEARGGAIIAR